MSRAIKQYSVCFKSASHPEFGQRRIPVNSPTKQWIKDNWLQLVRNPDLKIVSIDLLGSTQTSYAYR